MRDGKSMGNIPQATPAEHRRKSLGGSHGRLRTLKIAGGFPHAEAMIRYSPEYNRQTIQEEWSVLPGNCAETPVVEIESRVALSVPQRDFSGLGSDSESLTLATKNFRFLLRTSRCITMPIDMSSRTNEEITMIMRIRRSYVAIALALVIPAL